MPWGRRWSLDALLGGEPDTAPDEKVSTLAAGLFTLQLPFIYWLSVAHKFEPTWMRGEAVYYALRSTFYARSTGQVLLAHPDLLRLMTYGTLVWELLAPALLFAPWPRIRTFTSRSDDAHSSSIATIEEPVIHDLRTMETYGFRLEKNAQL